MLFCNSTINNFKYGGVIMSVISVLKKMKKKRLERKNGVSIKNLYNCHMDKLDILGDGTIKLYSYVSSKILAKDKKEDKFKDPLEGEEYKSEDACSCTGSIVVCEYRSIRNLITKEELKKGYITKARLRKINEILAR